MLRNQRSLLAIAIAGGSVIIGISLYSSARIDDRVQRASTETTAALIAADIQESIDSMYILGLSARLDGAAMGDPDTPVITIERAIQGHDTLQFIVEEAAALDDLVARQFFFLPGPTKWPFVGLTKVYARLLLHVNVDDAAPAAAVRELPTPLLLIHGDVDSQIPVEHARRIYANANPATTELLFTLGAGDRLVGGDGGGD